MFINGNKIKTEPRHNALKRDRANVDRSASVNKKNNLRVCSVLSYFFFLSECNNEYTNVDKKKNMNIQTVKRKGSVREP